MKNDLTVGEICALRLLRLCGGGKDGISLASFSKLKDVNEVPYTSHMFTLRKKGEITITDGIMKNVVKK